MGSLFSKDDYLVNNSDVISLQTVYGWSIGTIDSNQFTQIGGLTQQSQFEFVQISIDSGALKHSSKKFVSCKKNSEIVELSDTLGSDETFAIIYSKRENVVKIAFKSEHKTYITALQNYDITQTVAPLEASFFEVSSVKTSIF